MAKFAASLLLTPKRKDEKTTVYPAHVFRSILTGQNLVDAAYIAESFLRAWETLWVPLDDVAKQRYIREFQNLRKIDPPYTNWFLFSSTIESLLAKAGAGFDEFRVNTACRKVEEWYVGDGWYADGPVFAFDYYSSCPQDCIARHHRLKTENKSANTTHGQRLCWQRRSQSICAGVLAT